MAAARRQNGPMFVVMKLAKVLVMAAVATLISAFLIAGYHLTLGKGSSTARMAALEQVLKSHGTLADIQRLAGPPSQVFEPGQTKAEGTVEPVRFWKPEPGQQVHRYAEEALPCYFDLWLLIDQQSLQVKDWRLFRLDNQPLS